MKVVCWSRFGFRLSCTWVGLVRELDSGRPCLLCTPVLTIPSCCAVLGPSFCPHFLLLDISLLQYIDDQLLAAGFSYACTLCSSVTGPV